MLRLMANAPFRWSDFFADFIPAMLGFALITVPTWYFFGDEIVAFLRPYLG